MRTWIAFVLIAAYAAVTPAVGQIDARTALGGVISPGSGKDPEISAQRAGIEAQRLQAQSRFDEGSRQCYQKFAVNDCINNLRAQRRETLADLRRQEIELNNLERRALAAERVQSVEDKTRSADEREALASPKQPASQPELGSKPAAKAPKSAKEPKTAKVPKAPKTPKVSEKTKAPDSHAGGAQAAGGASAMQSVGAEPSASDRHQSATQRAQRAADRQARLIAAQEAAAKREKERQERGEKPVQGLPTPP